MSLLLNDSYIGLLSAFSVNANAVTASGKCGANAYWTFEESVGLLRITGHGDMTEYIDYPYSPFNNSHIERVIIENGITSVGSGSFSHCKDLVDVSLPNSITRIGKCAFEFCVSLKDIKISDGVECICDYAFYKCSSLANVKIPDSVKSINNSAFFSCESLTSIIIPKNVTYIGAEAFLGCCGITKISVSALNEVYDSRNNCNAIIKTADNKLIYGCKNTKIPNSVTSIGNESFSFVEADNLIVPDSVTSIDAWAFSGCKCKNIKLSDSITSIGKHAFTCTALISIELPENITEISDYAFALCNNLTRIKIPKNVTDIGDGAFLSCNNLKEIEIPLSVKNVDESAFGGCENLKDVYYYGTEQQWKQMTIDLGNYALLNANIHFNCKGNYLLKSDYEIYYKKTAKLVSDIKLESYTTSYSTSDPSVAIVDEDGTVTATGRGTATITCTVTDETGTLYKDSATVTVKFSFGQWLIWILLLGFLWY